MKTIFDKIRELIPEELILDTMQYEGELLCDLKVEEFSDKQYVGRCTLFELREISNFITLLESNKNYFDTGEDFNEIDYSNCDEEIKKFLPAWFTIRMFQDEWYFALICKDNILIPIGSISRISISKTKEMWIDVRMLTKNDIDIDEMTSLNTKNFTILYSPTGDERPTCSINLSNVIAAFEIQYT